MLSIVKDLHFNNMYKWSQPVCDYSLANLKI